MNKIIFLCCFLFVCSLSFGQKKDEMLRLHFVNYANGKQIILNDSSYTNSFGEHYTVTKLKYYISNIHFFSAGNTATDTNVYLIDASAQNIITIKKPKENITGVSFIIGIDSILNCSGAQSGALDPLNDMFWTWNNGYVMFKLEGKSDASKADNQRIEHHIGGYKGDYKTMRQVYIPLKRGLHISFMEHIEIGLNLDRYWEGKNSIKISEEPLITMPGSLAVKSADNFQGMFFDAGVCCFPL